MDCVATYGGHLRVTQTVLTDCTSDDMPSHCEEGEVTRSDVISVPAGGRLEITTSPRVSDWNKDWYRTNCGGWNCFYKSRSAQTQVSARTFTAPTAGAAAQVLEYAGLDGGRWQAEYDSSQRDFPDMSTAEWGEYRFTTGKPGGVPPVGTLESVNLTNMYGWVRDDDRNGGGPVALQIWALKPDQDDYQLHATISSDQLHLSGGQQRFNPEHGLTGGDKIKVRAIGVDSQGTPDGNDAWLAGELTIPRDCAPRLPAGAGRVTSESAQRRVSTVYLGQQIDEQWNAPLLQAALTTAGQEFGFSVEVLPQTPEVWAEDAAITRTDGTWLAPNSGPYLTEASEDAKTTYPQRFVRMTGAGTPALLASANANQVTVEESRVHLDGGNVLTAARADGTPVVLVSKGALHVSAALRERQGCTPSGWTLEQRLADATDVIAAELGVLPAQVVLVDQGNQHIDRFLRPGPAGKMFLHDPDLANTVLEGFIADTTVPAGARARMEEMRIDGQDLLEQRATTAAVTAQLQAAGLTPVPVPGAYSRRSTLDHKRAYLNFMNAVTGTAPDGTVYYLTNQTETYDSDADEGRPLKPLEDAFAARLATHGVTARFMPTFRLVDNAGGIDCVTLEVTQPS